MPRGSSKGKGKAVGNPGLFSNAVPKFNASAPPAGASGRKRTRSPTPDTDQIDFKGKGYKRVDNPDGSRKLYLNPHYDQSSRNVYDRMKNDGQPDRLNVDKSSNSRKNAEDRRDQSIGGYMKDNPGEYKSIQKKYPNESWDRDEYPPASTYQGGKGAGVRPILSHDNQGSGSSWWRHGTRGMKDGDALDVRPVKPKGAGPNWGLPSHMR